MRTFVALGTTVLALSGILPVAHAKGPVATAQTPDGKYVIQAHQNATPPKTVTKQPAKAPMQSVLRTRPSAPQATPPAQFHVAHYAAKSKASTHAGHGNHAGKHSSSCGGCGGCGACGKRGKGHGNKHLHKSCNMPQHIPYIALPQNYYYFRPYNAFHIRPQQMEVTSYGGDPRDPYANEIFRHIYDGIEDLDVYSPPPQEDETVAPPAVNGPAARLNSSRRR